MFPTANIHKADCINKADCIKKKSSKPIDIVGRIESIMVALYRNATDHPTVYHLTLLLDRYRQMQFINHSFRQDQSKITDSSSSQCSVLQSGCSICMNCGWEQRLSLLATSSEGCYFRVGCYFQGNRYFRGSIAREKIDVTVFKPI